MKYEEIVLKDDTLYSSLKVSTGLIFAALKLCILTVRKANTSTNILIIPKIHHAMFI